MASYDGLSEFVAARQQALMRTAYLLTGDGQGCHPLPARRDLYKSALYQVLGDGSAPLKISDDGRRIAYYRPADEHFVVRDLLSGDITVIAERVPLTSLYRGPAVLRFSGNGQRLSISFSTDVPGPALLADTTTGAVHTLPGSWVVGLARSGAAGDARQHLDLGVRAHRGVEAAEDPAVLTVDIDVDEPPQVSAFVPDPALQPGHGLLEPVEDRAERAAGVQVQLGGPVRLGPQNRRDVHGHRHQITAARTLRMSGRCAATWVQESPSSALAKTSPERVPK
jgi:hypothetical protein